MNNVTTEILNLLNASPADWVILTMGGSVVLFLLWLYRQFNLLSKKYQILNTNHMALWVMIAPDAVKWHHSGDYHIDIKALADIAEARNKVV